jgi:hypothetical protein
LSQVRRDFVDVYQTALVRNQIVRGSKMLGVGYQQPGGGIEQNIFISS